MRRLVLLANAFPYGTWETFLETELTYFDQVDRVDVMSLSVRQEQRRTRRDLPLETMLAHPIAFRSRLFYLLGSLRALGDANLYRELRSLVHRGRLSPSRLVTLFVFLSRTHHEAAQCRRILADQGASPRDSIVFYSYRFNYQPYLAWLLRRHYPNSVSIARAHRADLYEELAPTGYLPLREHTIEHLDRIYCIADHGRDYLTERFAAARDKTVVSRLGTTDHGVAQRWPERRPLRLVSCSTITPVKRLSLLLSALAKAQRPIEWEHFGEGVLREQLEEQAAALGRGPVRLTLRGFVSNTDLVKDYASSARHVLVNVSSSEGVPVSIMEAMSTGIPVIATDVGGTKEIVSTGVNGILLPPDPSPDQVLAAVESVASMDEDDYAALRRGARRTWEERCDAQRLYTGFAAEVTSLFPTTTP
ncbi:glycosyltransferase [Actinomyces slackii]|uniref:Spore coat protein SA n=1 Tax=Actinomyces slackii TaxID=52774 RepID=A0A3S5EMC7_9ACTO|nr:glycosyltransferase [Actinomyces slackii]VEG75706.1 Spore coat protein SA [Actinomyces slackii]